MLFTSIAANNPLGINDDWKFSANYPLQRLIDKYQGKTYSAVAKDRQLNHQIQLSIPYGNYKTTFSHNRHEYKHPVEGFNTPLLYHGQSTTSTLGIALAVAVATAGTGSGISAAVAGSAGSATLGAMAGSAFTTLVSQASISLINNQGNINATLKELGSKDNV